MELSPGTRLGAYEVIEPLGVGGMGEVYRARDARLNRDVALKVLPDLFAADEDRLARFQREAQVLAALNHPNIGHIYGFEDAGGIRALVLELVEGPTLAERILEGPIPLDESIAILRQVAEALEAAHDRGVVHRDLKPANIKVRPDGAVKVLDFGLAKLTDTAGPGGAASASMSPTLSVHATYAGVILGSAAYMSPEQARGKPVDKRTDVWAFGCVFFEMLAGKRAFDGEDVTEAIAAVVKSEPAWQLLPSALPAQIRLLLERCLVKDPRGRIGDIGTCRFLMTETVPAPPAALEPVAGAPPVTPRARYSLGFTAAGFLAGLAATALAAWALAKFNQQAPAPVRFAIAPPAGQQLLANQPDRAIAITPDGTQIVYRSAAAQATTLNSMSVRALDQYDPRLLQGIVNFREPFVSPDGHWVGYFIQGELRKVSISGGPPIGLARLTSAPRGASWGADGVIVFGTADAATGLLAVPAAGGEPRVLTTPDRTHGETDHVFPSVLPDGKAVLFTITAPGATDQAQVAVLDVKTGRQKILIRGGSQAEYVEPGFLVYAALGSLRAVRFDPKRLEVIGDPVPVVEQVATNGNEAEFAVSRTGTLVYVAGGAGAGGPQYSLVWVDRQGREEPINAPPRAYMYPRISPDGTRLALDIRDQESDIWIWDLLRQTLTRLTFDPGRDRSPVWTPDGKRIAYSSERGGISGGNIFWQLADGTGTAERLTMSENVHLPESFSPDGTRLVLREDGAKTGRDISVLLTGGARHVEPLIQTTFNEENGNISPDGNWLAYQSEESGQPQVYVRPFPRVDGGRWQISPGGGNRPLWARSGRELFYLDPNRVLMSVPVQTTPGFTAGNPAKVFDTRYAAPQSERTYDVSADGRRFLMIKEAAAPQSSPAPPINVVLHWNEDLRQRVPIK